VLFRTSESPGSYETGVQERAGICFRGDGRWKSRGPDWGTRIRTPRQQIGVFYALPKRALENTGKKNDENGEEKSFVHAIQVIVPGY
jgi:hypothetical protein